MYFSASQIEDPYRSPKKFWQFCHFLAENSGDNINEADDNAKSIDDENYVMLQVTFFKRVPKILHILFMQWIFYFLVRFKSFSLARKWLKIDQKIENTSEFGEYSLL